MSDYQRVEDALKAGTEPELLCATCPWDRYCVMPPEMTAGDVDKALQQAKEQDEAALEKAKSEGKPGGLPMGTLLTTLTIGTRHRQAQVCPVFAIQLRSSAGRGIVDDLKRGMQGG